MRKCCLNFRALGDTAGQHCIEYVGEFARVGERVLVVDVVVLHPSRPTGNDWCSLASLLAFQPMQSVAEHRYGPTGSDEVAQVVERVGVRWVDDFANHAALLSSATSAASSTTRTSLSIARAHATPA